MENGKSFSACIWETPACWLSEQWNTEILQLICLIVKRRSSVFPTPTPPTVLLAQRIKRVVRQGSHQGSIASESYPNMGAADVMDCMSDSAETEIITLIRHNILIAQTEIPEFTHRNRRLFFFFFGWFWLQSQSAFSPLPPPSSPLAAAIRDIRFTWTRFLSCRRSAIVAAALQEGLWDKQETLCLSLLLSPSALFLIGALTTLASLPANLWQLSLG